MKYLKRFEAYDESEIWMVPTKEPDYWVARWKIKMPDNAMSYSFEEEGDWILIHYQEDLDGGKENVNNWSWSNIDVKDYQGMKFVDSSYYKGKVDVTDDDIEAYKMRKEVKKYNL